MLIMQMPPNKAVTTTLRPRSILVAMAAVIFIPVSSIMAGTEILVVDPIDAVYPDIRPTALPKAFTSQAISWHLEEKIINEYTM